MRKGTLSRIGLALATVFVVAQLVLSPPAAEPSALDFDPQLSPQRLQHITTGDATGGGHLYGLDKPCKSEFPPDWTVDRIARDIPQLAANDNLEWQKSRNGYITSETTTPDGLKVRIVVDPEQQTIITAYPVNVARNPCPAANDNTAKPNR